MLDLPVGAFLLDLLVQKYLIYWCKRSGLKPTCQPHMPALLSSELLSHTCSSLRHLIRTSRSLSHFSRTHAPKNVTMQYHPPRYSPHLLLTDSADRPLHWQSRFCARLKHLATIPALTISSLSQSCRAERCGSAIACQLTRIFMCLL